MVKTTELLLLGGGLLVALYLHKKSNQIETIPTNGYYEQIQEVNIERLSQIGSRVEQLKDIRAQILDYEKGIAEEQISYLGAEIGKAQQVGSAAQSIISRLSASAPKLGYGPTFVTQGLAKVMQRFSGNLQNTFDYLVNSRNFQQAQTVANLLELQQQHEVLAQTQQFISQAQTQQADIMAKYSELEQIV